MKTNSVSCHHVQMYTAPYQENYNQTQGSNQWHNAQPVFDRIGQLGQSMFDPGVGTPVAPESTYNNQQSYGAQPRESRYEDINSNHLPMRNHPQGPPFNSQPINHGGAPFNTLHQFRGPGRESAQPRPQHPCPQDADGQALRRHVPPRSQGACGEQSQMQHFGDSRGGRASSRPDNESVLGRQQLNPTYRIYTTPGPGTLHDQRDSTMEQRKLQQTPNRSNTLSPDSSKSSPPYTSSQRKQLRVEEKLYLKEVKMSIAEGRVPKVHLNQNNHGSIMQYKSQFLNALKLAALSIEPNADIDVHNPSTMQEIMKEVRRQFIIEKPLPEGMVAGFLQRLYKRNRALWHRHWTLHGDARRPDDCSIAAWSQLVDYWKSLEGNKECERNKTNASSKKRAPVSFRAF